MIWCRRSGHLGAKVRRSSSAAQFACARCPTARFVRRQHRWSSPRSAPQLLDAKSPRAADRLVDGRPAGADERRGRNRPGDRRFPVLITQHMPPTFTTILAEHLARASHRPAHEAIDGEAIKPGHIYLAPGGRHMRVTRQGAGAGDRARRRARRSISANRRWIPCSPPRSKPGRARFWR